MRIFILFLLFSLGAMTSVAQTPKYKLTENSVVKDSSGKVYPVAIWKPLLTKGYSLLPVDPLDANTEFIIYKMTDEQQAILNGMMRKPKESVSFRNGEKFSTFKTTDIEGNKIDIRDLEGKILVFNFWFINCHPCRLEIPDLNKLVDSFKTNEKVVFIAVGLDDKSSIQEFVKKLPFNYTLIDNGRFIASMYHINFYPTHVIVDQNRKVYFHTSGLAPNTVFWIRKSIIELLSKEENKTAL